MAKKKSRGQRGGIKHQPDRGHDRKSAEQRKKRFARKALRTRQEEEKDIEKQWEIWDNLSEEQKRMLPDLHPKGPRKTHDDES